MFFHECERLAIEQPDLRDFLTQLDNTLHRVLSTASPIDSSVLGPHLNMAEDRLIPILKNLGLYGLLQPTRMIRCEHCPNLMPQELYDSEAEAGSPIECSSCGRRMTVRENDWATIYTLTRRGSTAIEDPARSDATGIQHVVILIHGIRDLGSWHQTVDRVLGSASVKVIMPKFGWFRALRFIAPWDAAKKPMRRVFREYENIRREYPNAKVSVIAHSFGTHLLTKLLREHPHMRIWRIVLCGSVVKQDFEWEQVRDRFGDSNTKTGFIVNDCGNRDPCPIIGKFAGWRYGNAGTDGFGGVYVEDRFHDGDHSLFFDENFIKMYWKPFIVDGHTVPGTARQGERVPWYVKILHKVPFNLQIDLLLLLLLAVLLCFVVH